MYYKFSLRFKKLRASFIYHYIFVAFNHISLLIRVNWLKNLYFYVKSLSIWRDLICIKPLLKSPLRLWCLSVFLLPIFWRFSLRYELWKPNLRALMEHDMNEVSVGRKTKAEVLETCLQQMKACFLDVSQLFFIRLFVFSLWPNLLLLKVLLTQ